MKKILIAAALLASFSFAASDTAAAPKGPRPSFDTAGLGAKLDSLKKANVALQAEHKAKIDSLVADRKAKDSAAFAKIPDSVKAKIDSARSAWKKLAIADTGARKEKVDSLKKVFDGKRDSAISKIKDTAVQNKIKAHLAEIDAHRAEIRAKIEAKKAEIKGKIEEIKAKKDAPVVPAK